MLSSDWSLEALPLVCCDRLECETGTCVHLNYILGVLILYDLPWSLTAWSCTLYISVDVTKMVVCTLVRIEEAISRSLSVCRRKCGHHRSNICVGGII